MKRLLFVILFFFGVFATPVLAAGDTYSNFADLKTAVSGTDYQIVSRDTRSQTAVVAIHGGAIEPGTSDLADVIAGTSFDFYSFLGMMPRNNFNLHITSTQFDEPVARSLVRNSRKTISVHGFASPKKLTYVSGRDVVMVNAVKASLTTAGFIVSDPPTSMAGTSPLNICNDNLNNAGVQIEVSSALRETFFASMTTAGRQTKTSTFVTYTDAIRSALV